MLGISKWFDNWEFFKCSGGNWNFGRFVAYQLFVWNSFCMAYYYRLEPHYFESVNNLYSMMTVCSGYIVGMFIYAVEIAIRERTKLLIKIGDKEYGVKDNKQ
jgi:hypothetical protein